jgi:hypothetical protein
MKRTVLIISNFACVSLFKDLGLKSYIMKQQNNLKNMMVQKRDSSEKDVPRFMPVSGTVGPFPESLSYPNKLKNYLNSSKIKY